MSSLKDKASDRNPAFKRSAEDEEGEEKMNKSIDEAPKKIAFGIGKSKNTSLDSKPNKLLQLGNAGFSIKLGSKQKSSKPMGSMSAKSSKISLAKAFNDEDEEEEEEMPPEAKMRMKNIGRDTPTSAGPNSFGKGRMGFCDTKKMYEKKLKEIQDQLADD